MSSSGSGDCHLNPHMAYSYTVEDNGEWSITITKDNTYRFGYAWEALVNGSVVISKSQSDGDGSEWSVTTNGNCGTSFTLSATCYSTEGCDIAPGAPYPHSYTIVPTIALNPHTVVEPTGFSLIQSSSTINSIVFTWCMSQIGTFQTSNWWYIWGTDAEVESGGIDVITKTGLTPGTSYPISARLLLTDTIVPDTTRTFTASIIARTTYATPNIELFNIAPFGGDDGISSYRTEILFNYRNTAPHTGDITYAMYYQAAGRDWKHITSTTITGLTAGTPYQIRVVATNPDGVSATSYIAIRTKYATPNLSIVNANKYNNHAGVSASTTSVKVSYSNSADNAGTIIYQMYYKKSTHSTWLSVGSTTISSLESGTSYDVKVTGINEDDADDTANITIRTKYADADITRSIAINAIGLEHVQFTLSVSPNSIASAIYAIGALASGTCVSGTAITTGYAFTPNTLYTILITITMSSTYDDITVTVSHVFTTKNICTFADTLGDFPFCIPPAVAANFNITNPSGNAVKCTLIAANAEICTRSFSNAAYFGVSNNLILTDDEWDNIYKLIDETEGIVNPNSNTVQYTWLLSTYSNRTASYNSYITPSSGTIQLTGAKKTMKIGVGDAVHRACMWIGTPTGVKRCVPWIGISDGPHRSI